MVAKAHVVVDYQNVHLTAHGLWCPAAEQAHHCLIHPLHYAFQLVHHRNRVQRREYEKAGKTFTEVELACVHSYRGLPSNKHDPKAYRRSLSQQSEWTRDRRSQVIYRPLKYYTEDNGMVVVKEKGIDVHVALKTVIEAASADKDDHIVILASHDTDQEPALELANQLAPGRIETAGWQNSKRLRVPGVEMWHTILNEKEFAACRDPKTYN